MRSTQAARAAQVRGARRLIQVVGLVFYLLAIQGGIAAGVGTHVYFNSDNPRDLILPAAGALLAAAYAFVGFHLRRYRSWARNFAFAFALISLFFFPVGTVLGALIVVCIDRANRARVFPARRRPAPVPAEAAPAAAPAPVRIFGTGFAAKRAG